MAVLLSKGMLRATEVVEEPLEICESMARLLDRAVAVSTLLRQEYSMHLN